MSLRNDWVESLKKGIALCTEHGHRGDANTLTDILAALEANGGDFEQANRKLRRILGWVASGPSCYTDDGEMHDTEQKPPIDYMRESPDNIENKLTERGRAALAGIPATVLTKPMNAEDWVTLWQFKLKEYTQEMDPEAFRPYTIDTLINSHRTLRAHYRRTSEQIAEQMNQYRENVRKQERDNIQDSEYILAAKLERMTLGEIVRHFADHEEFTEEFKSRFGMGYVRIDYTNHAGKRGPRVIKPKELFWGYTEWHQDEQWLLRADDKQKGKERTFAVKDIHNWNGPLKGLMAMIATTNARISE